MPFNNILEDAKEDPSVTVLLTTANADVAARKFIYVHTNSKAFPAPVFTTLTLTMRQSFIKHSATEFCANRSNSLVSDIG
jgi:hypothetical protein